jgi:glycine/D-amino acid oxidase-like deaminating enzyme
MRVLIAGSGVVGLTTAIELHERYGKDVEIIVTHGPGEAELSAYPADPLPGETGDSSFGRPVSFLAGGLIHPYTLGALNNDAHVGAMMSTSLGRWRRFLAEQGRADLLHWVPCVETVFAGDAQRSAERRVRLGHGKAPAGDVSPEAAPARWAASAVDAARWGSRCFREERGVGVNASGIVEAYAKQSWLAPILQTPTVLVLLRRAVASFATFVQLEQPLQRRADLQAVAASHGARYVIACLGAGMSCLSPPLALTPRGGQVLRVRFNRPVPPGTVLEYAADGATRYAIAWPNGEWIIGGTSTETGEDPAEYDKIIDHFRAKWGDFVEIGRGYGQRPLAPALSVTWLPGTNILQNGGHGGSGWTIPWATAQAAVDRIEEAEQVRARL